MVSGTQGWGWKVHSRCQEITSVLGSLVFDFSVRKQTKKKTKNTLYRYPTVIMLGPRDTPQGPLGLMPTGGPVAAPSSPGDEKDEA